MKRIFKLRSELAFFAAISLIIMAILEFSMREAILGPFVNSSQNIIKYIYNVQLSAIEYQLKNIDVNNSIEAQKSLNKFGYYLNRYVVFIVHKDGKVVASNNSEIKSVDVSEVVDGNKTFKYINDTKSVVRITGCDYLKDECYLYFIYSGYGMIEKFENFGIIISILIFVIVFFLLIWRRISYISKIESSLRSIATGNLSERVPLRYKNELRELAEDINYMTSKLEEEDKKRSEFLTNISHDLRTPLTTILGYINMIKNGKYASKDELNNYVDIMNKRSLYLKNMLDDFFQFSKLSSKDIVLEKQKLELNELVRQIAEEEENEFRQHGLELSLKLPQESIYVDIDCNLFLRAVNNLLSNALKYSKRNTKVEFCISKEKYNNEFYAVISVSNIAEEIIEDDEIAIFFERLYKKDLSRQNEGSGLGLSIVKDISKLHHGFVKAYKENVRLYFQIYIKESSLG